MPDPVVRTLSDSERGQAVDWAAERLQGEAAYVSHGEMLDGRAGLDGRWDPQLAQVLAREWVGTDARLYIAEDQGEWLGLLAASDHVIERPGRAPVSIAFLDDLIVDAASRTHGVGSLLVDTFEAECRTRGVQAVFLEHGHGNDRADRFFRARGYGETSSVMMKSLD